MPTAWLSTPPASYFFSTPALWLDHHTVRQAQQPARNNKGGADYTHHAKFITTALFITQMSRSVLHPATATSLVARISKGTLIMTTRTQPDVPLHSS